MKTQSPLGFTMPHSPLNQNDSIAASKAWQNFKQGYAKAGKVETGEYDREKHEFYYDTNRKKLRLVPTDDAERQDEGFKGNLKKWQLPPLDRKSPLNQNEKEVSDKRKTRLAEKVNKVKDNSPKGEKKFQRRLRKYEKATGSKDWWAHIK